MKIYHVQVTEDEGWFVGRVLEREGVTTQGRTLDELVFMVRDAIETMWNETGVHLELIITANGKKPVRIPIRRTSKISRQPARKAG